jgi:formate dehydrogenase accessory protein FdhE
MSVPVGPAFQAGRWDERIARARSLADGSPASAILMFYAELADFQRSLATSIHPDPVDGITFHAAVDRAAGALPGFLEWLRRHAPSALAQAAAEGGAVAADEWRRLLTQRIEGGHIDDDGPAAFVVEAALQPFVERAAQSVRLKADVRLTAFAKATAVHRSALETDRARRWKADATYAARCPICASAPVAAALREEGQGARRSLVCSLCFTEWDYFRIQCPACEENRFDALPVYTADAPAAARIDACDSCRTYIKTLDLTRDGLAVPMVDDLASLPLDLWARERGYQRLYPNLLRI